jgi:hypothetical protein
MATDAPVRSNGRLGRTASYQLTSKVIRVAPSRSAKPATLPRKRRREISHSSPYRREVEYSTLPWRFKHGDGVRRFRGNAPPVPARDRGPVPNTSLRRPTNGTGASAETLK